MKDTALILTNGRLATSDAKTAHGLIRGTDRFSIVGIIDPVMPEKTRAKFSTAGSEIYRFLNPLAHFWIIPVTNRITASSEWL